MTRLPVTLCVSTRNAGTQLRECVGSVAEWISELVVVDMESSDDTLAIAALLGATIVRVPAAGWAEPGRQAGIDAATQPWVLVLDADERGGPQLRDVVASAIEEEGLSGRWLARQNLQFGWWVPSAHTWPDWQLRLFRADRTLWPGTRTHNHAAVDGRCDHAPEDPAGAIRHLSYRTVGDWLRSADRYTELEADFLAEHRTFSIARLVLVPWLRFIEAYVRHRGYRAGSYGFVQALLSAVYWTLAELKLWERGLDARHVPAGSEPDPRGRSSLGG